MRDRMLRILGVAIAAALLTFIVVRLGSRRADDKNLVTPAAASGEKAPVSTAGSLSWPSQVNRKSDAETSDADRSPAPWPGHIPQKAKEVTADSPSGWPIHTTQAEKSEAAK